jgi:TatA/E family protein of Tat protein translocase
MLASPWKDTLVILVIVLLFVGPKRLPALSRSIGESIREFKGGISQISESHAGSELAPGAGSGAAVTPPAATVPTTGESGAGGTPTDLTGA